MKIAMIAPVPTHPPNAGNRVRILGLAEMLRGLGHEVHFLHVPRWTGNDAQMRTYWGSGFHALTYAAPDRLSGLMGALAATFRKFIGGPPRALGIDAWYDRGIDAQVRAIQAVERFDAVFVTYVFMSKVLQQFGAGVLRVIDTQDVFTGREERLAARGGASGFFSTSREEEHRGLERADVVMAIQEEEAVFFRSLTERAVVVVGHRVPAVFCGDVAGLPSSVLFLASRNPANVDALQHFTADILPHVRRDCPSALLLVAGTVCEALPPHAAYELLGAVAETADAYRRARVVICPIRQGTGLKVKLLEALAHGRPVVATHAAVAGLDVAGAGVHVAETDVDFAKQVVALLNDPTLAEREAGAARAFMSRYNATCFTQLESILNRAATRALA